MKTNKKLENFRESKLLLIQSVMDMAGILEDLTDRLNVDTPEILRGMDRILYTDCITRLNKEHKALAGMLALASIDMSEEG